MFVEQDFPARKPCLDKMITSPCYLSFGLVEKVTKMLKLYFFVITIYSFYYRNLPRKYNLSYTNIVVNKTWKKQNVCVAKR